VWFQQLASGAVPLGAIEADVRSYLKSFRSDRGEAADESGWPRAGALLSPSDTKVEDVISKLVAWFVEDRHRELLTEIRDWWGGTPLTFEKMESWVLETSEAEARAMGGSPDKRTEPLKGTFDVGDSRLFPDPLAPLKQLSEEAAARSSTAIPGHGPSAPPG